MILKKKFYLIILFTQLLIHSFTNLNAQSADEMIFMQTMKIAQQESKAKTAIEIGKYFQEKPYIASTLEGTPKENLVCNLREYDCWTFVENVFAITNVKYSESTTYQKYNDVLQSLRYRDGKINGYGSRLHYFIEWMNQAEKNGLVKNITKDLGGVQLDKPIHFMTRHRSLYAGLKEETEFVKVQNAENRLNLRKFIFIPKANFASIENKIQDGDIIAITSNIDGLDVNHEGFAVKQNGRIYLLHASQEQKKVVISDEPLAVYLNRIKKHSGVMVLRMN